MTKKTLITLLILIVVIAGVGFFLVRPGIFQIKDLRSELKLKEEELTKIQEFLSKFEVLKKQYEEGEEKREKLYQVLPQKPDIPGILVQLETLASENGLLLEDVNYSLPREGQEAGRPKVTFRKVVINLKVAGKYKAFEKFLEATQNNLRIMDISIINLSAQIEKEEGISTISYTYNLTMNMYYQE